MKRILTRNFVRLKMINYEEPVFKIRSLLTTKHQEFSHLFSWVPIH